MARVTVVLIGVWLLGRCASRYYYKPDRLDHSPAISVVPEEVTFWSEDGTKLHSWLLRAERSARATILQFHGQTENITLHVKQVSWLPAEGYDVFLFDYRGFGRSEGGQLPRESTRTPGRRWRIFRARRVGVVTG